MRDFAVRSVVDAGCGDWESTQAIDWTGIDYKGFDIVGSVIERDKGQFGKANVQFFQANIVDADLPPADLLICKQVLQHLPNAEVQRFLAKLGGYKHVLLIDSVDPISLSAKNVDIAAGDFRLLDLTRPPFNVRGEKLLTYWDGGSMEQVIHMKD
jgi:SAM-dependent methyltransferase